MHLYISLRTMKRRWRSKKYFIIFWISLIVLITLFIAHKATKTRPLSEAVHDAQSTARLHNIDINNFLKLQEKFQDKNDHLMCKGQKDSTVIMVPSSPDNFLARDAIRRSWGKTLPSSWNLIFYLGLSHSEDVKREVKKESDLNGDMAFGYFVESYKNLTLKTLSLLNWVNTFCPNPRYLLKVDDDNFLNIRNFQELIDCLSFAENNMYSSTGIVKPFMPKIDPVNYRVSHDYLSINYLSNINTENMSKKCHIWKPFELISYYISSKDSNYESYIAGGYLYKHVSPDRNPLSKWYLAEDVYPPSQLPNFLSGTSYLLSTNLLTYLLTESTKTPPIPLEDVYLTGILGSESLNLKLSHINGWSNFRPRWDSACVYHKLLTAHGLSATEMMAMTAAVKNLNFHEDCQGLTKFITFLNNQISYYFPRYTT